MHPHTCADKIDCCIHIKNNFIYNLLQHTIDIKATIPGTLCSCEVKLELMPYFKPVWFMSSFIASCEGKGAIIMKLVPSQQQLVSRPRLRLS